MADAIKDGRVGSYIFELEKFDGSPLSDLKNVIMMKPFAWFTKEALDRLIELWTTNIEAMAKNTPQNLISK
jgi:lactate dehydrogenase-like 2-hydroxyacid dehydrogenase